MLKDLKLETLEDVSEFLSIKQEFLKPFIDNGKLFFNGFSNTWFIELDDLARGDEANGSN